MLRNNFEHMFRRNSKTTDLKYCPLSLYGNRGFFPLCGFFCFCRLNSHMWIKYIMPSSQYARTVLSRKDSPCILYCYALLLKNDLDPIFLRLLRRERRIIAEFVVGFVIDKHFYLPGLSRRALVAILLIHYSIAIKWHINVVKET